VLGPREAREDLLIRSGLLTDASERRLSFYHFSIQEFLAAERIFELRLDELHTVFGERWTVPNWRNTLSFLFGRFMAAFTAPTRPLRLVEALIDQLPGDPFGPQTVAGDCAEMLLAKGFVIDEAQADTLRVTLQSTMERHAAASERCEAGNLLGKLGDPRFDAVRWHLPVGDTLGFERVDSGPFLMGSDPTDWQADAGEKPQHTLEVPEFYVGRFPVTVAQFAAYLAAEGSALTAPERFRGVPNHPVVNVSWHEAVGYCAWLTAALRAWTGASPSMAAWLEATVRAGWVATLPSEAEWEKAARGTTGAVYPWGVEYDRERANTAETRMFRASPVGAFNGGESPYHAHDMSGNVWEWTRSLWGDDFGTPRFGYPYDPVDGREDALAPNSVSRVVRGGSFISSHVVARADCRFRYLPDARFYDLGFRVVVSRC
jgi:formylglycine-generating enzyme required for sulfatase activity